MPVFNRCADALADALLAECADDAPVDLFPFVTRFDKKKVGNGIPRYSTKHNFPRCTLDVMLEASMGKAMNVQVCVFRPNSLQCIW